MTIRSRLICWVPGGRLKRFSLIDAASSVHRKPGFGKVRFEQVTFPRACQQLNAHLAHVPYWGSPLNPTVPTLVTIHDIVDLSEEGATQFFKPLMGNDLILGAVGILQFDVVAYRLKNEYGVEATFENVNVQTARWISCDDEKMLTDFTNQLMGNLARDAADQLVYLAPSRINLQLTEERWPDIRFRSTREL